MATAATEKKKCAFWDKCYRKNKRHQEEFLHPGDKEDEESTDSKTSKIINDTPSKPPLAHEISIGDDDSDMPAWRKTKGGQKRKASDDDDDNGDGGKGKIPASSTSTTPTTKKVKIDEESIEKISVDYSKPRNAKTVNINQPTSSKDDDGITLPSNSKTGQVIQYTAKREKCKYWDKCYQSNEIHLKEFYHPADDVAKEDEKKNEKKVRGNNKNPLNPFADGDSVKFNTGFVLRRQGDFYTCNCGGFTNQKGPTKDRTCKHLKEYLGEDFEKQRSGVNSPKKLSSHIQISLLLAHKYDEKVHNPISWWISEKLDGVRAFWNGRCFYSRLGNAFFAPEWFTKDLPIDIHLDGELFGGRGEFQSTVSIVKTAESPRWKDIKYYVFDGPHMGKDPFEKRMNTIKEYFEDVHPKYAVFVEQTKCVSKEQLDQMLTRILNIGGEGLMIRQPKSVYEATRSKTLLKIKKFYDAEAIVIAHEKGKGVNQNRCGALRCRMACGKEFSVGSGLTDKDRNRPPKVGSIITYKFQELSKGGSPRFPTYVGIRIDMTEPKDAEIREVLDEDEA